MPLLDGKCVSKEAIDPAKHHYIGMFRSPTPPTAKYTDPETGAERYADIIVCPCGEYLRYVGQEFTHWQLGHFDEPQYATLPCKSEDCEGES